MCGVRRKLGDAELEIMQVIWKSGEAVTSNYILKELQGRRKWQLSTLMTSLSRLCDKEFVTCDRSKGTNLYMALVSENDYKMKEGRHFLQRLYDNSVRNLVATLYGNDVLADADIQELRQFLDEIEEKSDGEKSS